MTRMDFDTLMSAPSRINPAGERELILRDNHIQRIENLTLTRDQYETIDLTNNDIRTLTNIPHLPHLTTLLMANNRITTIDKPLASYTPSLRVLMLTNNCIEKLVDIDPLGMLEGLRVLSLFDNPVADLKLYREYVLHRCYGLSMLDFKKVGEKERDSVTQLFSGPKGTTLLASITSLTPTAPSTTTTTTAQTSSPPTTEKKQSSRIVGPSAEELARIREAIKNAKTIDEVVRLDKLLQAGSTL